MLGQERLAEAAYFSDGLLATEGQAVVAVEEVMEEVMEEANEEAADEKAAVNQEEAHVTEANMKETTAAVAKMEAVEEAIVEEAVLCDAFDDVATVEASA